MESRHSLKGRIQVGGRAHRGAHRSGRDQRNATKRVANVSLPHPQLAGSTDCSRALPEPRSSTVAAPLGTASGTCCAPPARHRSRTLPRLLIAPDPLADLGEQEAARRREQREGINSMHDSTAPATTVGPATAADALLTPEELSHILGGVPAATLKRWRTQRTGPVALHIGRHVRYRRSAVESWLEAKDREAAAWMGS